jgi:hypothetical protein
VKALATATILFATLVSALAQSTYSDAQKKITTRLASIIIPTSKFTNVALADVLTAINAADKQADPTNPAIPITLDPADTEAGKLRLTFDLANIPESELIRYVAELAKLNAFVTDDGIILSTKAPTAWITKRYNLPQEFFGATPDTDSKRIRFLQDQGVGFPAGSSLEYDQEQHNLTVMNTEANMRLLDELIAAWIKSTPR